MCMHYYSRGSNVHKMMFAYSVALKVHEEEARGMLKMLVQLSDLQITNKTALVYYTLV